MPIAEEFEDDYPDAQIDYKQRYKGLKKKLRLLVYEQECFLDELRNAQRKLLKISRDRSFLLDRLLQQEKIADSSEESDATNSTDTEEGSHRESNPAKKRKLAAAGTSGGDASNAPSSSKQTSGNSESQPTKKKSKSSGKKSKSGGQKGHLTKQEAPGQMTREELERHLESKTHEFGIEKPSASLPMELFSCEMSDGGDGEEEEDDLIIDVPH